MKKILIFSAIAAIGFAGCKKSDKVSSKVVTVSNPIIMFTSNQYVSIPVGGTAPAAAATAYDSVLKESVTAVFDSGTVDNTTPGLYVKWYHATNSNGYTAVAAAFVAVTNISASVDVSGPYTRTANGDSIYVTKLGTGLFMTNNVAGVIADEPSPLIIPAVFALLDDSTMVMPAQPAALPAAVLIALPQQPTDLQPIEGAGATINTTAPITFSYVIDNNTNFGTSTRTFVHN